MVRAVLVVIALLILAWLFDLQRFLHVHASLHIPNLHVVLIVVLVAVILALAIRR